MPKKSSKGDDKPPSFTEKGGGGNLKSSLSKDKGSKGSGSFTEKGGKRNSKNVSFTGGKGSIGSDGKSSITSDNGKSGKKGKLKKIKKEKGDGDGDSTDGSDGESETTDGSEKADSDEDDSDDDSVGSSAGKLGGTVLRGFNKYFKRFSKELGKALVNYGPPYNGKPFNPELINECSKPVINYRTMHKILGKRGDPNLSSPDDLYYTPMHWCCRNLHFMGVKMLQRAGARIDIEEEMGLTPLDLVVMTRRPPDLKKSQIKLIKFLLANGADVNHIDKGGNSPIDHAAYNQDVELCELFVEAGANLLRGNKILAADREPVLNNVYDKACYKYLYQQLLIQQREQIERNRARYQAEADLAEQARHERFIENLTKRSKRKKEKRAQDKLDAKDAAVMNERQEKIQAEDMEQYEVRASAIMASGVWKRLNDGSWEQKPRTRETMQGQGLYDECHSRMVSLGKQTNVSNYTDTWAKATGGGKVEVPWKRSDPFAFLMDSVDKVKGDTESKTATEADVGGAGSMKKLEEENEAILNDLGDELESLLIDMA